MPDKSIALAITGASGAVYATRTLAALLSRGVAVELVVSDYGRRLLRDELGDEAALEHLKAAVRLRPQNSFQARHDEDFHSLAEHPVFRSLVRAEGSVFTTTA